MPAKPGQINYGFIVQINPDSDSVFGGCMVVVTGFTPKTVTGYIVIPRGKGKPPGQTFVERDYEDIHLCGQANWVNGTFLIQCPMCQIVIDRADAEEVDGKLFCTLCAK